MFEWIAFILVALIGLWFLFPEQANKIIEWFKA